MSTGNLCAKLCRRYLGITMANNDMEQNCCYHITKDILVNGTPGPATTARSSDDLYDMSCDAQSHDAASPNVCFRFLKEVVALLVKEVLKDGTDVNKKVVEFRHPDELMRILDLELISEPTSNSELLQLCQQIVKYSVKTGHPHFFNQLYGGLDEHGLAGAWMTEALNTSQYTFEVAPVFTLMEKVVLDKMQQLIGFPEGDAIFCPGGSIANMYAINLARFHCFPEVKRKGMNGLPRMCILTSEKGHYSLTKGAALLGLGEDNVVKVTTDAAGRMRADALDSELTRLKSQGLVPVMVNATSGTTVMGSYDPLQPIATICERHGVWLHVDAAWGGSVLLSDKLRYKVKGIERADSVTWNPHKMMGAPLQCSAFFTRHKNLMTESHSTNAVYLFQQDKFYDVSYDTGDKSFQCGRKVDVLKLWLMWKAKGTNCFASEIESAFDCAQYLANKMKVTEGFRLLLEEPECTNVCFWFIPPSLRNQPETKEWWTKLGQVAPAVKRRMMEEGMMLVGYQPDGDHVNFFRMVVSNTSCTTANMDFVVQEIARLGQDL
ncbi:cysteine sulfinic acid decarboxylase-like isoform X1 [Pomacea canaliculata]|uniref:cysteine sulfinic acid decarboxylase-like isoform X1 n=2 Tax=Pomacea canaliculata TaxID=400727 RepID=UPI000D72E63B|nr:cysteine sulfinic acid decarboxylase-like isoform X1 [Pomacea canaliculata]